MERVLGIGGLFFRAKDPEALSRWYLDMLGINLTPTDLDMKPWVADGGVTVFAPFPENTDYFPPGQQFMVNFRVANMDAMLEQLTSGGIDVFNDQTMEGLGRFVHLRDPEGNAIELWEPA